MACRGPDIEDENRWLIQERDKFKEDRDTVTRMLCEVMSTMEAGELVVTDELESWWKKHKELDAARKRAERVTKEARAKEIKEKLSYVRIRLEDVVGTLESELEVLEEELKDMAL